MSTARVILAFKNNAPQFVRVASFVFAACVLVIAQSSPQLPQVQLNAEGLTPRPIEELTGTAIARYYALAWHDLAMALESNQPDELGDEFVGFAKDRFTQRIAAQKQTGVHIQIVDHGHHLRALFYAADGTAMQLLDQAQLEIRIYDGNKLLDTENAPQEYMVLMTPGADRWYVRDLEEISAKPF
ncbi:MAG: hypothetical protein WBW85_18855 [Terriglobales bacterium]